MTTKNIYQARDSITTNQIINSRVSYKAGNFIILGRGFKIEAPGVFEATIEGCRN
ncbi:3-coathanger stack domain-containing protein [Emticicia soli]|uniref:3-coathanger stack domain-containing protein n=1 Tax=Emticicia soli TaxID=2027878 RepID=A0ABW5JAB6_9BACT